MSYETIEVELEHPAAFIRLNRPDKRNALSIKLRNELADCLEEIEGDGEIKAVLITGNGKAFCAGFDLDEFQNPDPAHVDAIQESSQRFHAGLLNFSKPIATRKRTPPPAIIPIKESYHALCLKSTVAKKPIIIMGIEITSGIILC